MKSMRLLASVILILTVFSPGAFAQPSLHKLMQKIAPTSTQPGGDRMTIIAPAQAAVALQKTQLTVGDVRGWLATNLELRQDLDQLLGEQLITPASDNLVVNRLRQYYKGIKVEHGTVNVTSRSGKVLTLQLEFYSIPEDLPSIASISESAALIIAAKSMNIPADEYNNYGMEGRPSRPVGELVIVRTYDDDSTVCLAWKFDVFRQSPMARAYVYVDATTGRVVLRDDILKHANTPGTATTRYSGTQSIITDNSNPDPGKPYRLRQSRNGHQVITVDYKGRIYNPGNDSLATDFTDNDNTWTAIEHYNTQQDDVALDVHFNMQLVSDYWKVVHNRNGWDNQHSNFKSFVHVGEKCGSTAEPMDNAFWSGSAMYFGDGRHGASGSFSCAGSEKFRPLVSLDVTAHEVGHAITQSTSRLIYRWESGALNEGFSDIWGAVIEQWGKTVEPTISAGKSTWLMGEEISPVVGKGLRNMAHPDSLQDPSTYDGPHWRPANWPACSPNDNNDNCGVHYNSGVLNKWFYLITQGESGTNTLQQPFSVTGMGFEKSRNLAYLMSLNLTPNAGFSTARAVSTDAAITLFGNSSAELETVQDAWRAVNVDSAVWDNSNTSVFAVNGVTGFSTIAMGKNNVIWAGTDKKGLYLFNDTVWTKRAEIPNVRINDIDADKDGGIWVAQSGTVNTGLATAGGVNYFADPAAPMTAFYTIGAQSNVPTRNVRSLYVDVTRKHNGTNPRVWIGTHTYTNSAGNPVAGRVGVGQNNSTPFFTSIAGGMQTGNTTTGITAIGGNKDTIWAFAPGNFGKNQILAYSAGSLTFLTSFDNSTHPVIPTTFSVTAIYTDRFKRTWFGLTTNAVLVYDELKAWHYINFASVFPNGSQVNANAITGSRNGGVYIGTTQGLVFFEPFNGANNMLDMESSYRLYQKKHGLPSNNVTGIVYDLTRVKLWVATDNGICKWEPLCIGGGCTVHSGLLTTTGTVASGNWSDPNIWEEGRIPDSTTEVFIEHDVVADVNAHCFSLNIMGEGSVHVNPGIHLRIYRTNNDIIIGTGKRKKLVRGLPE